MSSCPSVLRFALVQGALDPTRDRTRGVLTHTGADQLGLKEMIDQLTRDNLDALREPASADSDLAVSA